MLLDGEASLADISALEHIADPLGMSSDSPARYRVNIIKNGRHWTDAVGVTATPDTIAAVAVSCVAEAATECRPQPGDRTRAEVFDDCDRFLLIAELAISSLYPPVQSG